jgi:hypothetical protein
MGEVFGGRGRWKPGGAGLAEITGCMGTKSTGCGATSPRQHGDQSAPGFRKLLKIIQLQRSRGD